MLCIWRGGRGSLIAAFAALVLSCDDPAGNSGSIQVTLTPAGLSVSQGGTGSISVSISRGGGFAAPVADQTLALGPTMTASTATQVAAGPYPKYRFQGAIPAECNKGVSVDITTVNEAGNPFSIIATNAWLAGAGSQSTFDLTMPDVSGLPGFPAAARLTAGLSDASVSAFGFNGPGIFDLRPSLGNEFKAAARSVQIGVPQ